MRGKTAVLLAGIMMLLLAGCGSKVQFAPAEGNIFLKKDGGVTSADIDSFDKPEYSQEELASFIEAHVAEYNNSKAGLNLAYQDEVEEKDTTLPVAIEQCEVKDQVVTLLLNYASAEDYLAFNTREEYPAEYFAGLENYADPGSVMPEGLFNGPAEELSASGYDMNNQVLKVSDQSSVSLEEAAKGSKTYAAVIEGDALVQVEGKIVFASANVEITGDNSASCSVGEVSYIIYK